MLTSLLKIRRLKLVLRFFVINYGLKPIAWIVRGCVINYGLKSVLSARVHACKRESFCRATKPYSMPLALADMRASVQECRVAQNGVEC